MIFSFGIHFYNILFQFTNSAEAFSKMFIHIRYGLLENTENSRTGTGHGSIDSTHIIQLILDGSNFRMIKKDAMFKVIHDTILPLFNRQTDKLRK